MQVKFAQAIEVGRRVAVAAKFFIACALFATVGAAAAAEPPIKLCKDANGNPVAADRTDPRCFKAPLTPDEQAVVEERKRREEETYRKCKVEQRDLQTLLSRYPDKERHEVARRAAVGQVESSMTVSRARLEQLLKERKRLADEAEFYPKGNLPAKLRRDIDTNSALIAAQTLTIDSLNEEAAQKNAFYDEQLVKLRKLWLSRPADVRPCVAPGA